MKKFKNSRYFGAMVSLFVGVAILTTSVFANYENASGYSVCKNAIKNTVFDYVIERDTQNFTADLGINVSADGEEIASGNINMKASYDRDDVRQSIKQTDTSVFGTNMSSSQSSYQDGYWVYQNIYNGEEHNSMNKVDNWDRYEDNRNQNSTDIANKTIRFVETLADALVGDIKNYFVLADKNDEEITYTLNLSSVQLPEYVTAGISLATAAMRESVEYSTFDDEVELANTLRSVLNSKVDPVIESVSFKIRVNKDGLLAGGSGEVVLSGYDENGERHELNMNGTVDMYDYGTTIADRIDIDSLSNLQVYDYTSYNSSTYTVVDDETGVVSMHSGDIGDIGDVVNMIGADVYEIKDGEKGETEIRINKKDALED